MTLLSAAEAMNLGGRVADQFINKGKSHAYALLCFASCSRRAPRMAFDATHICSRLTAGTRITVLDDITIRAGAGCDRNGFEPAEFSVNADTELAEYFREAESWDADRVEQSRRSARLSLWVAAAGWRVQSRARRR